VPKLWAACNVAGQEAAATAHARGEAIELERHHPFCPHCGTAFFPLDEALALSSGQLRPQLQEQVVRLGSWLPFQPAAALLTTFTGVAVSEATVRRLTDAAYLPGLRCSRR
jgi:hypothetical protein